MHPKAAKLFSEPNIAHLATVMPDGSPQVTAVWANFEDGLVTVNTAEGRIKHKYDALSSLESLKVVDAFVKSNLKGRRIDIERNEKFSF